MGLPDRDYTQWKGSKRYKEWARSGHPVLLRCPLCSKESLFWNWRDEVYECLNVECQARGNSVDRLYRPHRVAYTENRDGRYTSKRFPRGRKAILHILKRVRSSMRRRWNCIPSSIRKLLLSLLVITGLVLVSWTGYLLFTHQTTTVTKDTIIFLVEIGFWIWIISILRSYKYKRGKPSFKLVFFSLLGIALVCAFAGIEPLTSYKDNIIESYETAQAERIAEMEAREAARVAQEHEEATARVKAGIQELANAERETFRLINAERGYAGVPPTEWDDELYKLSKAHTQAMADRGECFHSYEYGDVPYGENAWGGETSYHCTAEELPVAIVSGWKLSPLHWACLLHRPVKRSVVSIVVTPTGQYASWTFWCVEFGEGPELLRRAVRLWQAETGEGIPWLDWLDSKGYPYNTEWLYGE